jgi:hypothetical protein
MDVDVASLADEFDGYDKVRLLLCLNTSHFTHSLSPPSYIPLSLICSPSQHTHTHTVCLSLPLSPSFSHLMSHITRESCGHNEKPRQALALRLSLDLDLRVGRLLLPYSRTHTHVDGTHRGVILTSSPNPMWTKRSRGLSPNAPPSYHPLFRMMEWMLLSSNCSRSITSISCWSVLNRHVACVCGHAVVYHLFIMCCAANETGSADYAHLIPTHHPTHDHLFHNVLQLRAGGHGR